jgi:membrane protease YdiL (CAAX protease family)
MEDSQLPSERRKRTSPSDLNCLAASALVFACLLCAVWIGAWVIERALEPHVGWLQVSGGRLLYWLVMKLLLWIIPALVLIRLSGRTFREVMGLGRMRAILVWGGGVGLLLGATVLAAKTLGHQPLFSSRLGWPLFSGVIVSPIIEEVTFRGAILGAFGARYRFWIANIMAGAAFLAIHLPGWYFRGSLATNLKTPVGGALSIFLLGLVFGYVARRSRSVAASTLTHVLNNLFNA